MNLPKHRMGVHWIPVHQNPQHERDMADLGPSSIKIINPDPNQVRRCLTYIDPFGVVVLRDHPLSEQKGDMVRDPVGTGKRHAREWLQKFEKGGRFDGLLSNKIAVCGINEPFVHDDNEERIVFEYTKAFLEDCTQYGIRALALNLSVGWPRNLGRDMPPYWNGFLALEDVINRGNHFLCTHEYWYTHPNEAWFQNKFGWLAHRIHACPMQVPIIIGECGMEKRVDTERRKNEGNPPWGWIGNITAQQYADQLWDYESKLPANVFSIMPFTLDWGSHDWDSQDVAPAMREIIKRVRPMQWPAQWPVDPDGTIIVGPPPVTPSDKTVVVFPKFSGKITGFYGSMYTNSAGTQYPHEGLDLAVPSGTPVYAPFDGVVAFSDVDDLYGEYIRTYHKDLNVCFFFAHLGQRLAKNGDVIKSGQLIGHTGNSGNSSGPHLHLEVRWMADGSTQYRTGISARERARIDPLAWLAGWQSMGGKVIEK